MEIKRKIEVFRAKKKLMGRPAEAYGSAGNISQRRTGISAVQACRNAFHAGKPVLARRRRCKIADPIRGSDGSCRVVPSCGWKIMMHYKSAYCWVR